MIIDIFHPFRVFKSRQRKRKNISIVLSSQNNAVNRMKPICGIVSSGKEIPIDFSYRVQLRSEYLTDFFRDKPFGECLPFKNRSLSRGA